MNAFLTKFICITILSLDLKSKSQLTIKYIMCLDTFKSNVGYFIKQSMQSQTHDRLLNPQQLTLKFVIVKPQCNHFIFGYKILNKWKISNNNINVVKTTKILIVIMIKNQINVSFV